MCLFKVILEYCLRRPNGAGLALHLIWLVIDCRQGLESVKLDINPWEIVANDIVR